MAASSILPLDDLHDAILERVTIDVDEKRVTLTLAPIGYDGTGDGVRIIAHEWKMFSCPRQDPWGHAAAWRLNVARGPLHVGNGLRRLELEMQSGDIIEIHALM